MEDEELEELTLTEQIEECYKTKNVSKLREIFETTPNIDIAEAMEEIEDVAVFLFMFRAIKDEYAAEVFAELSSEKQEVIINSFGDKQLVELLNNSFTDDIVDTLEDMPANIVNRILKIAPKDLRNDINRLLNYKENTAGSMMTTEYIEMKDTTTVGEAIKQIRKNGRDAETIYTIFVRDKMRTMVGTVDLDDLIFAEEDKEISEIMNRDFVTCNVNDDQETVANMFSRYDLTAMAVVNKEGKICGIITIDDAVDILMEEAAEDVAALGHVAPLEDSYLDTTPWQLAKKCIPWIIVLLILGTFTTLVLDKIEKAYVFTMVPVLICFVPTLMDTGGNSGGQTIALMIRGLATKEFGPKDFLKVIWKEARSAIIVSVFISLFAFVWFTIEQYVGIVTNDADEFKALFDGVIPTIWNGKVWTWAFASHALKLSATVALTLLISSFVSKMIAVTLPLTVAALKKDPAIIAQPLLTTFVDVISLLLYLGIATLAFLVIK